MISERRRARINQLDAMLRSTEGLPFRETAKKFGIEPVTLELDLKRLKQLVGQIVSQGRGRNLVHRYADPKWARAYQDAESSRHGDREAITRHTRRMASFRAVTTIVDKLKADDEAGAAWLVWKIGERYGLSTG